MSAVTMKHEDSPTIRSGRLLTRLEVEAETRLSRSSIYRQIDAGTFPRPIRVGVRAVAWWQSDIENWKISRPDGAQRH